MEGATLLQQILGAQSLLGSRIGGLSHLRAELCQQQLAKMPLLSQQLLTALQLRLYPTLVVVVHPARSDRGIHTVELHPAAIAISVLDCIVQ